jgi:sugar/nucleoside kinase (ribokinase family)
MKYIIAGNVMVDSIYFRDGRNNRDQLGGPAPFAYTGVKLWTDDCLLVCNVGADFYNYFDKWLKKNNVSIKGIKIKYETCNHSELGYNDDGTYGHTDFMPSIPQFDSYIQMERLGYLKTTPEEIGIYTICGGVKGVYVAQNCDPVIWDKMGEIKKRDDFELMWEIETIHCLPENLSRFMYALKFVDILSINLQECQSLFQLQDEDDVVKYLLKLPVRMIVLRVGDRGLYTVCDNEYYFHPSAPNRGVVDPTGCGNTSTGAALFGYCETHDPVTTGVIANIASAYNVSYYGLIPDLLNIRAEAIESRRLLEDAYRANISIKGVEKI